MHFKKIYHPHTAFQEVKTRVRMVDVSYVRFVIWNGSLNMVDVWYTYFDMQGRGVVVDKHVPMVV